MSSAAITLVTSNTTLDPGYNIYLVNASSNSVTLTLPPILGDGEEFTISRIDTAVLNIVTLTTSDGQNINFGSSINIGPQTNLTVSSYLSAWYTVNGIWV